MSRRNTRNSSRRHPTRTHWLLLAFIFAALSFAVPSANAAEKSGVMGRWLTEDGSGVVEFYPCPQTLCGRIVWIKERDPGGPLPRDGKNEDIEKQQRPICGLVILGGFTETAPDEWTDGWIYSPENGKTYSASIRLDAEGKMKLRGYLGISLLGETQTWTRADPHLGACRTQ